MGIGVRWAWPGVQMGTGARLGQGVRTRQEQWPDGGGPGSGQMGMGVRWGLGEQK